MGRWLAAIAVLCGGCNLLFGLDPTKVGGDGPDAARIDGAPPDVHDEDGDLVADLFDVCPHVFDPEQADLNELGAGAIPDGVGDACDPHATAGGDALTFFDPFTASSLVDYQVAVGDWSGGDDALRTAGADEGRVLLPGQYGDSFAQVTLDVEGLGSAPDPFRSIGLWIATVESPAPRPPGLLCCVSKDTSSGVAGMYAYWFNDAGNATLIVENVAPADPTVGTWTFTAEITTGASGTSVICTASSGGILRSVTFAEATYTSGRYGVYADGLAVTVPNVVVYESGSD